MFGMFTKQDDAATEKTTASIDAKLESLHEKLQVCQEELKRLCLELSAEEDAIQTKRNKLVPLENQLHDMPKECKAKDHLRSKIAQLRTEMHQAMNAQRAAHELQLQGLWKEQGDLEAALKSEHINTDAIAIFEQRLTELRPQIAELTANYIDPRQQELQNRISILQQEKLHWLMERFSPDIIERYARVIDSQCAKFQSVTDAIELCKFYWDFFETAFANLEQEIQTQFLKDMTELLPHSVEQFVQRFVAVNIAALQAAKAQLVTVANQAKNNAHQRLPEDTILEAYDHTETIISAALDKHLRSFRQQQETASCLALQEAIAAIGKEYINGAIDDCETCLNTDANYLVRFKNIITEATKDEIRLTAAYHQKQKELYLVVKSLDHAFFIEMYPLLYACLKILTKLYRNADGGYLAQLRLKHQLQSTQSSEDKKILEIKLELYRIDIEKQEADLASGAHRLHFYSGATKININVPAIFKLIPLVGQSEKIINSILNGVIDHDKEHDRAKYNATLKEKNVNNMLITSKYFKYNQALLAYIEFDAAVRNNPELYGNHYAILSKKILLTLHIHAGFVASYNEENSDFTRQRIALADLIIGFETFHNENYEAGTVCDNFKPTISLLVHIQNCLEILPRPPVLSDFLDCITKLIDLLYQQGLEAESNFDDVTAAESRTPLPSTPDTAASPSSTTSSLKPEVFEDVNLSESLHSPSPPA